MQLDRLDEDPRWDQLVHYFADELPADQASALAEWIDADADRRARVEDWRAVWQLTNRSPRRWDVEAELRRLHADEAAPAVKPVIARIGSDFARMPGARPSRWWIAARVAAVVAIVAGAGLLWRTRTVSSPANQIASGSEYRTTAGQRVIIPLADGTQVTLAPNSTLRLSPTYGRGGRDVTLDGEAYFVVTHDASRPFVVRTARAVAHDLGTRFIVRAYADEPATDVVVAEGRVAVRRADSAGTTPDSVVLGVRQQARLTPDGRIDIRRDVALETHFGWTDGRLVFEQTPLRDAARQLERWYGVRVRLADAALGDRRVTATLSNESADQALDLIGGVLELAVDRTGRTYTVRHP